jgi:hypothetical protein
MQIFDFRDRLIDDYASYVKRSIEIREERGRTYVDAPLNRGLAGALDPTQIEPRTRSTNQLVEEGSLILDARRFSGKV